MRKLLLGGIVTLFALSLACGVSAQTCDEQYGFVKVLPRAQETGQWCWAATQQMVMESHGNQYFVPQCLLVTEILRSQGKISRNVRSCCDPEHMLHPRCSRGNWPDFPLKQFNPSKGEQYERGLSWDEIRNQICRGNPIVITLDFKESAHQFVISGYRVNNSGKRLIYVIDPIGIDESDTTAESQASWRPFQVFYVNAWAGRATHSYDYVEICPLGSMNNGKCE